MTAQYGQVLGQMRSLHSGLGLEVGDADFLLGTGEEFEDADAQRVGETFEEVRLRLIQRALRLIQWHDETIISNARAQVRSGLTEDSLAFATAKSPVRCCESGLGSEQLGSVSHSSVRLE